MVHYGVEHILQNVVSSAVFMLVKRLVFKCKAKLESDGARTLGRSVSSRWLERLARRARYARLISGHLCGTFMPASLAFYGRYPEQVREELLRLSALWQAVAVGQTLTLQFDLN